MAFCSFSKDVDNSYTVVENKFITKFLPEADGFAVKVYLYGLYLCKNSASDFTVSSMAEVLKTTEQKIIDAFQYWQDYDLVEILCKSPFSVQYLPITAATGKPKRIHYEQYADFNKELQHKLQRVGKFISANDYVKYMRFLEENIIQPQAFLLIVEYCIQKQGDAISPSYIFNKAKKLLSRGLSTYEQVERELSSYNAHEDDLNKVFIALSLPARTPDESDYALYKKWTEELGFTHDSIIVCAKKMKKGSITSLDLALTELAEKGKTDTTELEQYLTEREYLANLTFRISRKLGAKVANPAPYIDEYTEKWFNCGFDESSLLDVALFCMKTARGDFDSMNGFLQALFTDGIISKESVKSFLKEKNAELKLFAQIQEICGTIRKNAANLALIKTWRDWKFSDEMILEAAKRSASSSNPVPYMNKILSDWKQGDVYAITDIPNDKPTFVATASSKTTYNNPVIQDVNAKSDRERYYSLLREKAQTKAEKYVAQANANVRFKEITAQLSKMELSLAKAEIFEPATLPTLLAEKQALLQERKDVLTSLGIDETQLIPQFACKKCSDTGFLPSGAACNCYKV